MQTTKTTLLAASRGHEEVQIAKEAKGLLIGLAIIVTVFVISALVAKVYYRQTRTIQSPPTLPGEQWL